MSLFIPYIFKVGFSAGIFFLIYFIFLRKETFFKFNRFYLFFTVVLSFIIPFAPVNIDISRISDFTHSIENLVEYRKQYEYWWTEFEDVTPESLGIYSPSPTRTSEDLSISPEPKSSESSKPLLYYITIIYLMGVAFYISRLIIRLLMLSRFLSKCKIECYKGVKLAISHESVSPFAFGNYMVTSQHVPGTKEFDQIFDHEIVHIKQLHSYENIIMELVIAIAWFHPLLWLHRNAIKENHEFLADQGALQTRESDKQSYQELILKQLISENIFELANSLNFKPLKRRLKMMTKSKSRRGAMLKVLAALPLAALLFLLFANLTVSKNGVNLMNSPLTHTSLEGIWLHQNTDDLSNMLGFEGNTLHLVQPNKPKATYSFTIENNTLILDIGQKVKVPFEETGNTLKVWWTKSKASTYTKSKSKNSFELFQQKHGYSFKPVELSNYRLLEKTELAWSIVFDGTTNPTLYLNNQRTSLGKLKSMLESQLNETPLVDIPFITIAIYADAELPMKHIIQVRNIMREVSLLKVGYGGIPKTDCPKVMYHTTALARKLPPIEAANNLSKEEVRKSGTALYETNGISYSKIELRNLIGKNGKVIIALDHDENLKYGKYIKFNEVVQSIIYDYRNQYAQEKFGMSYLDLPSDKSKIVKKRYPMMISEAELEE